jgi:ComF family protein
VLQTLPLARKAADWLSQAGDALASVLLAADCRLCEKLLVTGSRLPICAECLASFQRVPARICDTCGQPLESLQTGTPAIAKEILHCPNCRPSRFAFACARSLTIYQDSVVSAILILKYQRMDPLAKWFAKELAELARQEGQRFQADVVVPVPLHPARQRDRGFNQAALLAKPLARELRIPYRPVLLQRIRERPQKRVLSIKDRWEAVQGAFAARPGGHVDNLRVLLLDDVLTTGATLSACSQALLDAGAKSVVALTVARAANSPVNRSGPVPGPSESAPG